MPDTRMPDRKIIRLEGIFRGANNRFHPNSIPDEFWAVAKNANFGKPGSILKQQGTSMIANDLGSSIIRGLREYAGIGLIAFHNGEYFSWVGTGNWTSLGSGFTAEDVDMVSAQLTGGTNVIFFFKQTDVISYYDGGSIVSATDTNTDPPKCLMASWMLGIMFAARTGSDDHSVFYSDALNPLVWNRTTNRKRISPGQGGAITGLKPWTNQDMVICKEQKIFVMTIDGLPADWPIIPVTDDIGCLSHKSLAQVGDDFFFYSHDGVRSVRQSAQDKKRGISDPISAPIQQTIDTISENNVRDKAAGIFWKSQYLLAVPINNAFNDTVLVFDSRTASWSVLEDIYVSYWAPAKFSGVTRLYYGDSRTEGKVHLFEDETTFDRDGVAVSFEIQSKAFDFQEPHRYKKAQEVELEMVGSSNPTNVGFHVSLDGGAYSLQKTFNIQSAASPALPIALPFALGGNVVHRQKISLHHLDRFRNMQIRLTNEESETDIEFRKAILTARVMNYTRDNKE